MGNLEWCDGQYNMDYSFAKPVKQIDMQTGEVVGVFKSARHAAKTLGLSAGNIWHACNGKWNYYNGYKWFYVEEEVMR